MTVRKPQHLLVVAAALVFTPPTATAQQQGKQERPTYIDESTAREQDPDFALQGEYAADGEGVQVVALGDGQFRVVRYPGGLPGLGWNRQSRDVRQLDAAAIRGEVLPGMQRIVRSASTLGMPPPAGAVVLFDGTRESLTRWRDGARISEDGLLMEGATSASVFGSARVHVEFRLPYKPHARGQGRGNSGLYVQGRYETQMLDSFGLEGKDNECGGIYSVRDPDLNMCLPPLSWQVYDIDFTAATFDAAGNKTAHARMTVRLNGVVIHDDVEVPKSTTASPIVEGPDSGPLHLQDHGNPVRYRNVWVLPKQ